MAKKRRLTGPLLFGRAVGEAALPSLSAAQVGVLRALGDFLNWSTWECYPSVKTLARHAHTSPATVARALQELEQLGIITRPSARARMAAGANGEWVVIRLHIAALRKLGYDRAEADRADRGPVSQRAGGAITEPADPHQADRETNHSTNQSKIPAEETNAGGPDPQVRRLLVCMNIAGPTLDRLAELPITPREVRDAIESIRNNPAIEKKTGALIRRLEKIGAGRMVAPVYRTGIGALTPERRINQARQNAQRNPSDGVEW